MDGAALDWVMKAVEVLKVGGPYTIMIVEGYVIYRLWKNGEELHKKLEKK